VAFSELLKKYAMLILLICSLFTAFNFQELSAGDTGKLVCTAGGLGIKFNDGIAPAEIRADGVYFKSFGVWFKSIVHTIADANKLKASCKNGLLNSAPTKWAQDKYKDDIFTDGFESGDTSAWTGNVPDYNEDKPPTDKQRKIAKLVWEYLEFLEMFGKVCDELDDFKRKLKHPYSPEDTEKLKKMRENVDRLNDKRNEMKNKLWDASPDALRAVNFHAHVTSYGIGGSSETKLNLDVLHNVRKLSSLDSKISRTNDWKGFVNNSDMNTPAASRLISEADKKLDSLQADRDFALRSIPKPVRDVLLLK